VFAEAPLVRVFRRNAAHIRGARERLDRDSPALAVHSPARGLPGADVARLKAFQALAIPLRRALSSTDRASFARTRAAFTYAPGRPAQRLGPLDMAWAALDEELNSTISLGGEAMDRRAILGRWLDAVVFFDPLDKRTSYDELLERLGPAAETIAAPLAERAIDLILELDAAAADVLEEPLLLPPPEPAKPSAATSASWWRRLMNVILPR
jgi:hypothetical protein